MNAQRESKAHKGKYKQECASHFHSVAWCNHTTDSWRFFARLLEPKMALLKGRSATCLSASRENYTRADEKSHSIPPIFQTRDASFVCTQTKFRAVKS